MLAQNPPHPRDWTPARQANKVCPGCGYQMDTRQIVDARFNFVCPGCGKHELKDFVEEDLRTGA